MHKHADTHLHMDVEICNWNKLLKWHMTENRVRNRHRHILNKSNRSVFHLVLYIFHPSQSVESVFFFSVWKNLRRFFSFPIPTNPVIFNPPLLSIYWYCTWKSLAPFHIRYDITIFDLYITCLLNLCEPMNIITQMNMICVTKENHLIRINI